MYNFLYFFEVKTTVIVLRKYIENAAPLNLPLQNRNTKTACAFLLSEK